MSISPPSGLSRGVSKQTLELLLQQTAQAQLKGMMDVFQQALVQPWVRLEHLWTTSVLLNLQSVKKLPRHLGGHPA